MTKSLTPTTDKILKGLSRTEKLAFLISLRNLAFLEICRRRLINKYDINKNL